MLVRVYENPDGSVRVVYPNPRLRDERESEAAFLDRIAALTEERDPTLQGLPSVDVNTAALPARSRDLGPTQEQVTRDAWRLSGGRVVIDETKVITRERNRTP